MQDRQNNRATTPAAVGAAEGRLRFADWLNRVFAIEARGSSLRTECLAGATTFATMAYVLAVHPQILADAGMDRAQLITVTALAAGLFSILMGLMANLPMAQAPGMGANALFAYTIVLTLGVPWPAALGLVFWSGAIFLLLTLTGVRQRLLDAFPQNLKIALTVGIGLFIAFIGVKNAGLVVAAPAPMLVGLGDFAHPAVAVVLAGLALTVALTARGVPGAMIMGIAAVTAVGFFLPGPAGGSLTATPEAVIATPVGLEGLWLALDFGYLWFHLPATFPALLTLVFLDLFSSLVAMNAMCKRAGLADAHGNMVSPRKGLSADALATMGAAMLGSSTTNVFAESAAGIESGGRTGLTAIVTGLLFLLALFLNPLLLIIPPQATAPALMIIGMLMFSEVRHLDFDDSVSSGAAVLTLFLMPVTSITDGLAIGLLVYVVAMLLLGRGRDISALAYVLSAAFAAYYAFV